MNECNMSEFDNCLLNLYRADLRTKAYIRMRERNMARNTAKTKPFCSRIELGYLNDVSEWKLSNEVVPGGFR